jgi:putative flippase GtrA
LNIFRKRFLRFVVVGIGNTVVGYTLFALIYLVAGSYISAVWLATIVGVIFNFFTSGRFVFDGRSPARLFPFALVYAVICVLNTIHIRLLTGFGVPPLAAQLLFIPFMIPLSYFANARYVFGVPK